MYTEHVRRSQLVRKNRRMLDKETKWERRELRRTGRGKVEAQKRETKNMERRGDSALAAITPDSCSRPQRHHLVPHLVFAPETAVM
jgi:hypothetical protein